MFISVTSMWMSDKSVGGGGNGKMVYEKVGEKGYYFGYFCFFKEKPSHQ